MATVLKAAPRSAGVVVADLAFGKANYSTSSTSFSCMKVTAPFIRNSAANAGRKVPGASTWIQAGTSGSNGGFKRERVEHQSGTIIVFQATRMSNGIPVSEGAVFARLRDTGPMYEVYGKLPTSHQNVLGDEVSLATFRGDLLTLSDLQVAGIEVPRIYRQRYMQAEEIIELLAVQEIQAEIKPRPQFVAVSTEEGVIVQEVAQAPARRLRFRNPG